MAVPVVGGELEAEQASPEGLVEYKGWQPGWPELCACWPGGPPHPG